MKRSELMLLMSRAIAVVAVLVALVCVMCSTSCMTSFDDDEQSGASGGSWVAQWLLRAFSSGDDILLDSECKADVRLKRGADAPWIEVKSTYKWRVRDVYAVAKKHPRWAWGEIMETVKQAAELRMEADMLMAGAKMILDLELAGHDPGLFKLAVEGVFCSNKPRHVPPPEPVSGRLPGEPRHAMA